jgi:uncharacterized protein (TIGR03083 family)
MIPKTVRKPRRGRMKGVPQAEHIRLLFEPRAALTTLAGQRRRFASIVETLSAEELASPSRCAEWTVADVVRHLVWVDRTVRGIWSGEQSVPEGFDPRVTPNDAVRHDRATSDEEIRDHYLSSTEIMLKELECSDTDRYGMPSLSPAGRVPWWMSAVHIGWDSSVHERDVVIPVGRGSAQLDSETELCLAYSLVLASFFAGRAPLTVRIGTIELRREDGPVTARAVTAAPGGDEAVDPAAPSATVVTADDPVKVVDAMCGRGPVETCLTGDAAVVHRLGGLARYFTSPPG